MQQCLTCGATREAGQDFCYNCGRRLVPEPTTTTADYAPATVRMSDEWNQQPITAPAPPSYPMRPVPLPLVKPCSSTATLSLIFGILAWLVLPFIAALPAVILGHMARGEIRRAGGQLGGEGQAMAGLVLGYIQLGMVLVALCLVLLLLTFLIGGAML